MLKLAAIAGVDLENTTYTPRELFIIAEEKQKTAWDHTSGIMAKIHNVNCKNNVPFNHYNPFKKDGKKGESVKSFKHKLAKLTSNKSRIVGKIGE